ncbi:alpha-(1,3)-fucosyltransferase 11-like [Paramuricea clavata]|uniref:Fucosyltransferase n=1 Tax=Paramuricea clavata TaxID=317549 RepID=A0A6S7LGA2_PARCT|nr:alpha-(1,3)-fucosyltransferase 11-like [Paramuricea clavata]
MQILGSSALKVTFYGLVILTFIGILLFATTMTVDKEEIIGKDNKISKSTIATSTIATKKVVILYWSKVFSAAPRINTNPDLWPFFYAGNNCPITCELTTDKKRVGEASALVVHARNTNEIPPKIYKHLPWILHTNENPNYTPSLRDPNIMKQFNYLASYRLDADFTCSEFTKPSLDPPEPFAQKSGLVMAAFSHCETVRTRYLTELMKHIKVDSYGGCLRNKNNLVNATFTFRHSVTELQRNYKFSIVFPNSDCAFYMTEKIQSALTAGSVPIWLGTDGIDEVLRWGNLQHSVIKVKDFSSPKALAEYLTKLSKDETEYNKYLKWKFDGFQFPKEYYKSAIGLWWDGLPLYCRVCLRVSQDPQGRNGLPVDRCDGPDEKRTLGKWLKV